MNNIKTRELLLTKLENSVAEFIKTVSNFDNLKFKVGDWTAKKVLIHITFWHESFAKNVSDIVKNNELNPLKGKYSKLNQRFFDEMQILTKEEIIKRLKKAQRIIKKNILNSKIQIISYRIGSRKYSPIEHLQIVIDHLRVHQKELIKRYKISIHKK
jgi:hypothetical protein